MSDDALYCKLLDEHKASPCSAGVEQHGCTTEKCHVPTPKSGRGKSLSSSRARPARGGGARSAHDKPRVDKRYESALREEHESRSAHAVAFDAGEREVDPTAATLEAYEREFDQGRAIESKREDSGLDDADGLFGPPSETVDGLLLDAPTSPNVDAVVQYHELDGALVPQPAYDLEQHADGSRFTIEVPVEPAAPALDLWGLADPLSAAHCADPLAPLDSVDPLAPLSPADSFLGPLQEPVPWTDALRDPLDPRGEEG